MLEPIGQHLLCEYHGCELRLLDDQKYIEALLKRAAEAAGARVVGCLFHRFAPQGLSGVLVVEESHLSIHTWPGQGYAAVDFFTCGNCQPEEAHRVLQRGLRASCAEVMTIERGRPAGLSISRRVTEGSAPAAARRCVFP